MGKKIGSFLNCGHLLPACPVEYKEQLHTIKELYSHLLHLVCREIKGLSKNVLNKNLQEMNV